MALTTSEHDLGGFQRNAVPTPANPGRSRYCYLFPDAARDSEAGLFAESAGDEEETLRRLLAIAAWLEQQNSTLDRAAPRLQMPIPAVYTYFGQFVNHDISAPVGGLLRNVNSIPDAVTINNAPLYIGKTWRGSVDDILLHFQNEHAHPLSLNSLYAGGPFPVDGVAAADEVAAMYEPDGLRFRLGKTRNDCANFPTFTKHPELVVRNIDAPDIPRQTDSTRPAMALIADRRNDENLILSQIHLAMMLLHNKAIDTLRLHLDEAADCFAQARQLVTRHYHWCILHDFLPQLLSKSVLLDLAAPSRLTARQVPLEFITAAFRFGHSMVADGYDFNANFGAENKISTRASLVQLFSFTTRGGMGGADAYSALPDHWVVDWNRLTNLNPEGLAKSEQIDMVFAQLMMRAVQDHNDDIGSIIGRNLARGFQRRIPFGQVLARAYGVPVLSEDELRSAMPRGLQSDPLYPETPEDARKRQAILQETPAWVYFLCEAKVREGGTRLGATASHILADTFVGLLQQDEDSILGAKGAGWEPSFSPFRTADGRAITTVRDLLLFAIA